MLNLVSSHFVGVPVQRLCIWLRLWPLPSQLWKTLGQQFNSLIEDTLAQPVQYFNLKLQTDQIITSIIHMLYWDPLNLSCWPNNSSKTQSAWLSLLLLQS